MKRFLQRTDEEIREAWDLILSSVPDARTRRQEIAAGAILTVFHWLMGEEKGFGQFLDLYRRRTMPPRG